MKVALLTLVLALSSFALVGCDEKKSDSATPSAAGSAAPSAGASAAPAQGGW